MICVSIAAPDMKAMLEGIRKGRKVADILELRVDGLEDPDLFRLIEAARPLKVIVTNRSAGEGGLFSGLEGERVEILREAIYFGADYVDLEWQTAKPFREKLISEKGGSKIIFSYHDFQGTPPAGKLVNKMRAMSKSGADIVKIVTMATSPDDNLTLLSLLPIGRKQHIPLITFCMGEMGKISRLATLVLGGFLTYASLGTGKETAPGQISAPALVQMVKLMGLCYAENR